VIIQKPTGSREPSQDVSLLGLFPDLNLKLNVMAHPRQSALQDLRFNQRVLEDAINGVRIPDYLGLELVQLCVVAGIRRNAGFGHELRGLAPRFTRALNAQAIMYSREIPDMNDPEEFPYCIWYLSTADRDTCRKLIAQYPWIKYQVGRVCAVASYCIWFPQPANRRVYEVLARLRPDMKLQAARACIVANYQPSFEKIDPPYDSALVREAQASPNPFFLKHLQAKEAQGDTTGKDYEHEYWEFYTIKDALGASSSTILGELNASSIGTTQD
jgi:hypothetical protein